MDDKYINCENLEIRTINTPKEGQYPFIHKLVKGDWIEVSDALLIDCTILPYVKFIKKKFYYKNKIFRFLHLPKWRLFGFWMQVYEWLG